MKTLLVATIESDSSPLALARGAQEIANGVGGGDRHGSGHGMTWSLRTIGSIGDDSPPHPGHAAKLRASVEHTLRVLGYPELARDVLADFDRVVAEEPEAGAIDHYREGLYVILRGNTGRSSREIAASYLGEDERDRSEPVAATDIARAASGRRDGLEPLTVGGHGMVTPINTFSALPCPSDGCDGYAGHPGGCYITGGQ